VKFRSKFEKKVYEDARSQKRKLEYEPQEPAIRYVVPSRYIPDFRLGNGVLLECKGYFDARARAKMLRVRKDNPDLDIRFVFQRANNRLTKSKNSMTYWEWAEKHGFPWAEGSIPEEWYK
jgi:hypothetical protein